jgi:hypothetical protein
MLVFYFHFIFFFVNLTYVIKTKPTREEEQMFLWIRETSGISWLNENLVGLL